MKKVVLFFSLIIATIVGTISVYAAEEYIWIEAESVSFDMEYRVEDNIHASGDSVITLFTKEAPENGGYKIDFMTDVSCEGKYDIWILSTSLDSGNYSKLLWNLNDGEKTEYIKNGEEKPIAYKHKAAYVEQDICWSRLVRGVDLAQGQNTVSICAEEPAKLGSKSYFTIIDCLVIVPNNYSWQPQGNIDRPEKPAQKFALIELENPTSGTRLETVNSDSASGGKMLYSYGRIFNEGEDTVERLSYSFGIDEDADYDIWYLGCAGNSGTWHLSGVFWGIDNYLPSVEGIKDRDENAQENSLTIMNSTGATSEIPLYWHKLGTETLTAGGHSLNLAYIYRELGKDMTLWADCVLVVPTEWEWTPPTEDNEEKLPAYSIGKLDGRYIAEKYFNGDYSTLTENIALPTEALNTPAKSVISFESDNIDLLSETGEVKRPYYNQENANVNFMIAASRDGKKAVYNIPMTILRYAKYQCRDFRAFKTNGTITAEVYLKLMAAPDSDEIGSADIIIAYYNDNGILQRIQQRSCQVGTEETLFAVDLKVPEKSGYAKVFIINNTDIGKRLTDTFTIR